MVPRTALLERISASAAPIVSVVAPAGYGKTTLLGQWVSGSVLPSTWLSLDRQDDDAGVLLSYLVAALERIEPIDTELKRALLAESAVDSASSLRRLAILVSSMRNPFVIVLDHVEMVTDERSGDLIAAVALNLPDESRLALGSRTEPPIPIPRLRASGDVEVVGRNELSMDELEAGQLLAGAGTPLNPTEVKDLVARTEGWPVGLYLASLALRTDSSGAGVARALRGDERVVSEYLRAEVISSLPPASVTFLTRTSVLDQLSGPLCDAVLATTGSQKMLESLEESNLLLVPLDGQRHWYRCHHLLGELLRAELERTEPELVSRVHDRAAAWFEANGQPDRAIEHAQAAGDADRAARLFGQISQITHALGRGDTVFRWLRWFDDRGLIDRYPHVAVLGVFLEALAGDKANAQLMADAALAGDLTGLAPDGSPLDSWIAVMEALLCQRGVDRMRADATRSTSTLSLASPFRGPAALLEGIAALLQGDASEADPLLAGAAEICLRRGHAHSGATALAERAVIALDQGDWTTARRLSTEAVTVVANAQLEAYVQSTLVHAVAARTAAHEGDVQLARTHIALATRVRPRCTAAIPWSAQFLLQLAHACLAVADPAGARAVLRQVRDILIARPDLGVVPNQCAELDRQLDRIAVRSVGASSLTAAELRLLPLLATHLSYRDIGARLHVSVNTIKSEAASILRKLGVSSRSDAVQVADGIGLLGR